METSRVASAIVSTPSERSDVTSLRFYEIRRDALDGGLVLGSNRPADERGEAGVPPGGELGHQDFRDGPSLDEASQQVLTALRDGSAGGEAAGDEAVGVSIIKRALGEPLRLIAANAGHVGAVVLGRVRELKADEGFSALTEKYENLVDVGVIGPTKVVRSALQNAASIASLLLTTEAIICEIPEAKGEKRSEGMAAGGDMY